jgi:hypothetical protein
MATYFIPAASEAAARAVVAGIEIGRIPRLPEYVDPIKAHEAFDSYPLGFKRGLTLWVIERRAVDDGVITNVWPVLDKAGEIAAALFIVIGGAFAVGFATLV